MPSMIHAVCRRGNHGAYQRRVYMTQNDSMNETYKRLLQAARELKSWETFRSAVGFEHFLLALKIGLLVMA